MVTAWHATSLETEKTSLSPDCSLTESSSAIVSSGYGLCVLCGAGQKAGVAPSEGGDGVVACSGVNTGAVVGAGSRVLVTLDEGIVSLGPKGTLLYKDWTTRDDSGFLCEG